jgi:hypothetical protein
MAAPSRADPQDRLLAWLGSGGAYGMPEATVERIDTHAASVFLVGDRAYKVKRAVRYSFLDFTTLAARHQALEAELRLNRRTAPELYRRILPVTARDGGLALDGAGAPLEWLLEMGRFDQAGLLDRLAAAGRLDRSVIEPLAKVIAAFHEQAERRHDAGGYDAMLAVVRGNGADLAALTPALLEPAAVEALQGRTLALLDEQRGLLDERRADGKVRLCHGDLHLGNIVLLDGRPVLFDCLEFDPALASIDVLYDLAFLLMDLCQRELRPLAGLLLDRYLDHTLDDAGTALLPLFMAVRATIRAKVEGFNQQVAHPGQAAPPAHDAAAYLRLASTLLAGRPPRLVAIGGLSGSGKSTIAQALAPELGAAPGAIVLRSDIARKRRFGLSPTDRLRPDAYHDAVTQAVYDQLAMRALTLLRAGRSVIVDATFQAPARRAAIEVIAARAGVPFTGLWLEAPAAVLRARIAARTGDPSDATPAVLERQLAADPGPSTWQAVDATGDPPAVAVRARQALGEA